MDEKTAQTLLRKLDVLISILLDSAPKDRISISEKARRLSDTGLSPSEIGAIIGKKANYVSAVLGGAKGRPSEAQ